MVLRLRPWLTFAVLASAAGCRREGAIDADLAACVPPDAIVLAGLDLDRLRAAPLYRELSLPALEVFRNASYLLATSNGAQFLLIARGKFSEAPAGTTLIRPTLAAAGSPDMTRAAIAQHRTGRPGTPLLLARGAAVAAGSQIWAVAPGGIRMPLPGNAANLNRLFQFAEYVTLSAKVDRSLDLDLTAHCRGADSANRFEESLRGIVSLLAAGYARQQEVAAVLRSVIIEREGAAVHARVTAGAKALGGLLRF